MGRPRKWANQAHKQAAYRTRKEEENFNNRMLAEIVKKAVFNAKMSDPRRFDGLPDYKVLELILQPYLT